jgi:sulfur-oxidizing protein SoxZ
MGDDVRLEIRIKHPMESGARRDAQGQTIPAKFIQHLTVSDNDNGETLFHVHCGPDISRNPYFALELLAAQTGKVLNVEWQDNLGDSDSRRVRLR